MRWVIAAIGVVVVLGVLGAIKGSQFAAMAAFGREQAELGPPPEAVGAWTAYSETWERTIDAIGSVASARGVAISAEVAGVVSRIAFTSGTTVEKGDVLLELDASVERAQLQSALAAENLAKTEADRSRMLIATGAASQQELDQADATLRGRKADVAALRAQIARKIVRAPFSGRLGIRAVDLGQYLAPGTSITQLETTDALFVDFTIPQQRLFDVAVGMPVRIVADGRTLDATIAAVEPVIDLSTRAIRLRARAEEDVGRLRAGMFVTVQVLLPGTEPRIAIPATAVVHASYGDSVFVIEDKPQDEPGMRETEEGETVQVARQQFVRTGTRRGDFVAIEEGIEAGDVVVSAGAFKLKNGAPIVVSDRAVAEPQLEPHPENR